MVNLDIQLPTERRPNDVTIKDFIGCFSNISNAMKSTDRVLFIDEANALMKLEKTERDNLALEQLLNWFLHATKETNALHIWLVCITIEFLVIYPNYQNRQLAIAFFLTG